ncbi:tautomerase family protein [Actinomadura sp. NAK00032]|uniref:tautomerase family protein n=1 Tax=Actinomadura sp. NAK00032 TaxID=2742128 RepID=UPI001590B277|nr:tautomerase family protein [Actinomadura sp. NAK00032]QKW37652.1 tautomerase family protein [Actinomadura sp. NAK00032]
MAECTRVRLRACVHYRTARHEDKRELVEQITKAFADAYGLPAATVDLWIQEVPADSRGRAGRLVADK